MAEPNKMLEETANYLLNHCFVLGGVEDQRAKYLYVQDHLPEVRAVFALLLLTKDKGEFIYYKKDCLSVENG